MNHPVQPLPPRILCERGSERMKKRMSARSCGILAAAALGLAAGCDNSTEPKHKDTGPAYLARTSPLNLLENLRLAYVNRDLVGYDSLLATGFEFYFSAEDQYIAEKFTRIEELAVHGSMCSSTQVESVTVSFIVGALTLDTGEPDPENPGQFLWTLTATNADLVLRVNHGGQPAIYEVQAGIEQFWFREESWTDARGNPIWTIVKWRELSELVPGGPARPMPGHHSSWGEIKLLFR